MSDFSNVSKRTHWVYRCFADDGSLLYVGMTQDLQARQAWHQKRSAWWPHLDTFTLIGPFVGVGARQRAAAVEARLILEDQPRYNRYGITPAPRRRPSLKPSAIQLLADELLGSSVIRWIVEHRTEGCSRREIAYKLHVATKGRISVTSETIRVWLLDAPDSNVVAL